MSLPAAKAPAILVGLAGQPNVGKSTVFNLLTGLHQHVGNWPGKTVERREGALDHAGVRLTIVDLPGTYSLTANSPEERVARDFILHEHPDVVMMIADAAALERNLYLLSEVLALPAPVVLGLNMMDVAQEQGIDIEPHVLAAALGIPVIPMVARRAEGVAELVNAALCLAQTPAVFQPVRPTLAEPHRDVLAQIRDLLEEQTPPPYPADWVAMKLLEGDREMIALAESWLPEPVWRPIEAHLAAHEDAVLDIAAGRYAWIERMVRAAIKQPRLGQISLTDHIDRYALHPVWGLLLLLAVFALIFVLTFQLAAPIQAWLETGIIEPLSDRIRAALLDGSPLLANLLADGVLGGAGAVMTFVPILVVFFAGLAVLEDTGYFARAAYVMDRYMHHLGLHGKSFLPLSLGFGCNVPAVLGTRVIDSPSGRLLTILLVPFVPCSARLLVLAFLTPIFFGQAALLAAVGFVSFNLILLTVVGIVLSRTLFRGQQAFFIMEMPLYHAPNGRTIARFVWENAWAFLRKAGSLILMLSILLWALSYFPDADLETSYLARLGHRLAPAGELLGLDWRLLVALLASFIAKENAIAALGILYGAGTSDGGLAATLAASIPPASGLSFIAATLLFIPCVATCVVMRKELGDGRWMLFAVTLHGFIAVAIAALIYHGSSVLIISS
jgi:ferrous iron transport protein B